jgi:WD40 repeat protein
MVTGKLLWDIHHESAVNCAVWLYGSSEGRYLATGCSNGRITIWLLNSRGCFKPAMSRSYDGEIEMMAHDASSRQLLFAFQETLVVIDTRNFSTSENEEGGLFCLHSSIYGIGFLMAGSCCIASLPHMKKMSVF